MIEYILSLDPSGSFDEGKGTTGYAILDIKNNKLIEVDVVRASSSECAEDYWCRHVQLILNVLKNYPNLLVRCEDYLLYKHKAKDQIMSRFETPQLIGIVKYICYTHNIPLLLRTASTVKNRWTDEVLEHKGYINKINSSWYAQGCGVHPLTLHERDAIRHAVACYHFDIEERETGYEIK